MRVAPEWAAAGLAAAPRRPARSCRGGRAAPTRHAHVVLAHPARDRAGPYFQTCNIFYPRAVLERLGGFDADSFTLPGGEDTDWLAAFEAGRAPCAPGARAYTPSHGSAPSQAAPCGALDRDDAHLRAPPRAAEVHSRTGSSGRAPTTCSCAPCSQRCCPAAPTSCAAGWRGPTSRPRDRGRVEAAPAARALLPRQRPGGAAAVVRGAVRYRLVL